MPECHNEQNRGFRPGRTGRVVRRFRDEARDYLQRASRALAESSARRQRERKRFYAASARCAFRARRVLVLEQNARPRIDWLRFVGTRRVVSLISGPHMEKPTIERDDQV
jgi:hypothetical protein